MVYEIYDYDGFKAAIEEICAQLSVCSISKEKVFDCRLICSELIANVLQHSGGSVRLQVETGDGFVTIALKAERAFCPADSKRPTVYAERGRGIYLVDSLCAERRFTEDGQIVVKVSIE